MVEPRHPAPDQAPSVAGNGISTLSMSSVLALSFGSLILVSVLVVLALAVHGAVVNTTDLLLDKADAVVDVITDEIDSHLESAHDQARFVARSLETGQVGHDDPERIESLLHGAMAADPAIGAIAFLAADGSAVVADREADPARSYRIDYSTDTDVRAALDYGRTSRDPAWGAPIYRPDFDRTILSLTWPVHAGGDFRGVLVAVIHVRVLSEYLENASRHLGPNAFVLFGRDRVLAHRLMADGDPGRSLENPLPPLDGFGDPVLGRMWDTDDIEETGTGLLTHETEVDGVRHVFIYRRLEAYTIEPWYAGAHFRFDVISAEFDRLTNSIAAGLVALLLSILLAFFIGQRLSRPLARLSSAARLVGEMRFEDIRELPRSRVRELDEQSGAFNAMARALKWFQAYVPRSLVRQLVREGDLAGLVSGRRNLTVMFTDIAGYSTISEGRSAAETARLLNDHFAIVTRGIERSGGTVDKFIGDSVMAFWGAPEKQKDRALRACRAALAIRDGIADDNRQRAARGEPPVRMRIGIHSGSAVAGNIGTRDRVNYTVIGDDVNVAQRLEQLGKQLSCDDDVTILVSAATAADLDGGFELDFVGDEDVKGRLEPVRVYRLVGAAST